MPTDPDRRLLLELFACGLAAVHGRARMRAALAGCGGEAWLLAVGKAAAAMALGAFDALGDGIRRALVISRAGHFDTALEARAGVTCLVAGHPVPDAGSLAAGEAALAFARAAPPGARVLLLVSGGASSLLEVPAAGVTLADLARVNRWALASGRPIDEVNAIRRRLSRVKGGGLVGLLRHARVAGYAISDVPGDDPAVIGSGLLAPPASQALPAGLPDWLERLLARTPPPAVAPAPCPVRIVGCLADALAAIEAEAGRRGLPLVAGTRRLAGDAAAAAAGVVAALEDSGARLLVAGGEVTVTLPASPGRGGRNQHLALEAACRIAGGDLLLLAAGTDGTDGNSGDAGALVDGSTLERAALAGLDARVCLARADSGTLLEATGDLVHTGPTGTNVGDLVLVLHRRTGHGHPAGRGG